MANLLPASTSRRVVLDHEIRFAVVAALALLGLGFVVAIVLLPSYVVVSGGATATTTPASVAAQVQADEAALARAQALIDQFTPATGTSGKGAAIATALVLRPKGVRIHSISYSAGQAGATGVLQIAGMAEANADIEAYKKLLQAAGPYTSVTIPVSALVGTTKGEFTVTLTGTF